MKPHNIIKYLKSERKRQRRRFGQRMSKRARSDPSSSSTELPSVLLDQGRFNAATNAAERHRDTRRTQKEHEKDYKHKCRLIGAV